MKLRIAAKFGWREVCKEILKYLGFDLKDCVLKREISGFLVKVNGHSFFMHLPLVSKFWEWNAKATIVYYGLEWPESLRTFFGDKVVYVNNQYLTTGKVDCSKIPGPLRVRLRMDKLENKDLFEARERMLAELESRQRSKDKGVSWMGHNPFPGLVVRPHRQEDPAHADENLTR